MDPEPARAGHQSKRRVIDEILGVAKSDNVSAPAGKRKFRPVLVEFERVH